MKHVINVTDDLSDTQRRNIYRELKSILSDIGTPSSCACECALNWKTQERLKLMIKYAGRRGFEFDKGDGPDA